MVMETPSAQSVGREFVRQYYTLLHEAPDYLHRFYSHNSCFVHGGVEKPGEEQPPVQGQAEIHKKIMSLKYQDCHAKIRQVDSQPTVGNAVVVQVTGELSNNGQPMRRFMQTFVLAPQSPKKYYVHNDVFRYQDEVFHDLDASIDGSSTQQTATQDASAENSEPETEDVAVEPVPAQPEQAYYAETPQQMPLSNGTSSDMEGNAVEAVEEVAAAQPEVTPEPEVLQEETPAAPVTFEEPAATVVPEEKEAQPEPVAQEPQKPVSWAALASQRPAQSTVPQPAPAAPRPVVSAPVKAVASDPVKATGEAKPQAQRAPRAPRGDRGTPREQRPAPTPAGGEGQENGTQQQQQQQQNVPQQRMGMQQNKYSDAHQLFVGNLPHNIEEPELKDFFERDFGKVIEVRINRKSSSTRDVPNFGFVVFQSPETVGKVLQMRPIMLRDDLRLNVEEKKQRGEQGRPGSGSRGGRGGGQMMGGRGGQGMGGRGGRGGAPPRGGSQGNRGSFPRPR